jgi:formate dehydrogenase subunit delta
MTATATRLVHMANQIATAFRTHGDERAAAATHEHISQFWDPRMRRLIVEHLQAGGADLSDVARTAIARLTRPKDAS